MLTYPDIDSVREIQLYQEPVQGPDESDETFKKRLEKYEKTKGVVVRCKLVSSADARRFFLLHQRAVKLEREAQAAMTADDPERDFGTEFGIEKLREANLVVIRAVLVGVSGIEVGSRSLEKIHDVEELIRVLDFIRLLPDVAAACRSAQVVDVSQKKR